MCLTDVMVNRSLIISPSRNCVGRGLAVSRRPGGLCPGQDSLPGAPVSWGWRMVIASGFTRLRLLLLVYGMCPSRALKR